MYLHENVVVSCHKPYFTNTHVNRSITDLTTTVDRPFILRGAHGRRGEVGWFDAVLLDVALCADESATALLRAEGVGGTACDGLLADAGTVLILSSNLGGRGVRKDEEDGDRRPGEDDGGEDLHLAWRAISSRCNWDN